VTEAVQMNVTLEGERSVPSRISNCLQEKQYVF
jgi:hypothetical protein